ncbi:MAG: PqiC family protein [Deltaproteobacteria bacterium]|nr:PqiC family protein [Deltaproteobacteria bacterium]
MTAARLPLAALALALALGGCTLLSGPKVEPTRFYVLTAAPAMPTMSKMLIGLGPVRFPGYLDRPQMAMRADANRIEYSEWARWAEPLKDNFERVLGSDLSALLGTDKVVKFPWYRNAAIDYSVTIDVSRFERQGPNEVGLLARWTVRDGESGSPLASDLVDLRHPASTPEEAAAAMSELVEQLAVQIAAAVPRK